MRSSFFIPMTGDKFPVTGNKFPVTGNGFPGTGNKFPVTGMIFLVRENSFLMNFWCITFRDKCAGFTIKISCETLRFRGNLVPRFPVIFPPWCVNV